MGRIRVIKPSLDRFRLKDGVKVAELCFEGNSGIVGLAIWNIWIQSRIDLLIYSGVGCE